MRNADKFMEARKTVDELMAKLYDIRYSFMEGNSIAKDGSAVWEHIPRAQDLLVDIKSEIMRAQLKTERWHAAVEPTPTGLPPLSGFPDGD